jgi:predicted secreted protein
MPGIGFSPQWVHYALAEYGERDLGFSKSEAQLVLDHLEGTESDDVTGQTSFVFRPHRTLTSFPPDRNS